MTEYLPNGRPVPKKKLRKIAPPQPPVMPGTPGTQGRGGAALYVEPQGQRQDRYPTIPYNLPGVQKRRDYGLDLANLGVRFENPNGFPVPEGFQEHIYNAIMRSPSFASYVRNVGVPRWDDGKATQRGHIIFHIGTGVDEWGSITRGNAAGLAPNSVGGLYNSHDVHVRVGPDLLQTIVNAGGPKHVNRRRGSLDPGYTDWLEDAYGEEVLLHEIGHHVDAQLKLSQRQEYAEIAKDPMVIQSFGGPGAYGNSSIVENFAGAYQKYVQSPQTRRSMDPRVRVFFDKYVDPLLPHRPALPRDRRGASALAKRSAEEIHKVIKVADWAFRAGFSERHIGRLLDHYDEVNKVLEKRKTKLAAVEKLPTGRGPRYRRMAEKKSRDAPPPEDMMPFPDYIVPGKNDPRLGPPKHYHGVPQGRSANDMYGPPSTLEPIEPPRKKPKRVWT